MQSLICTCTSLENTNIFENYCYHIIVFAECLNIYFLSDYLQTINVML